MSRPPRIMLTAGEASGDRLGAGLARAILRARPDAELFGMGGRRMADAGVRLTHDYSSVAVNGIVEVLRHLSDLRAVMGGLERELIEQAPDLLVPIDAPDFNLRLAARAKRAAVPVVYFVSPQVWAWRKGRVRVIRRRVRRMLVLFPFETGIYEEAGVPVTFVGHPLAESPETEPSPARMRERAGLDPGRRVVALLPGSRRVEVERIGPILAAAAELLAAGRPDLQFLVPVAPGLEIDWVRARMGDTEVGLTFHAGDFPEILHSCAAGAVAAGTASLEAAVTRMPLVVVYRMSPLSYGIGRALVRLPHYSLPNLVAGREVVRELIQGDCTPERIAAEVGGLLDEPERAAAMARELDGIRSGLGAGGVYERAAEAVLGELDRG
ncbi:MAG: lipid-A-disaccharide synthase [bacterium]|nr:lipid-A-disaccharide synthase [bacterium]